MKYIKLLRPKNYLKNLFILLPIVFGKSLFAVEFIPDIIFSLLSFCALSSAIYIFNDLCDKAKDRTHPIKCKRPIASGSVSTKSAIALFVVLLCVCVIFNYFASCSGFMSWFLLGLYLLLNVAYSINLKNIPILDIAIIASGFLIRVFYGSIIFDIEISKWFYLTILVVSFYLGLSKRRNEYKLVEDNSTRDALKFYNFNFLDKNMHIFSTLTIVFYSLWCVDDSTLDCFDTDALLLTIPFVILICITYNYTVEKSQKDDVVDILFENKVLIFLIILLGVFLLGLIYLPTLRPETILF